MALYSITTIFYSQTSVWRLYEGETTLACMLRGIKQSYSFTSACNHITTSSMYNLFKSVC